MERHPGTRRHWRWLRSLILMHKDFRLKASESSGMRWRLRSERSWKKWSECVPVATLVAHVQRGKSAIYMMLWGLRTLRTLASVDYFEWQPSNQVRMPESVFASMALLEVRDGGAAEKVRMEINVQFKAT